MLARREVRWIRSSGASDRSAARSGLGPDHVAEAGGLLVVLARDGLVELLAQGLFDGIVLADLLLEEAELVDKGGLGESVGSLVRWSHQVR